MKNPFKRRQKLQHREVVPLQRRQIRPDNGQGPFTASFSGDFIARDINANFFEILREAIPVIDAAIWKLTTIDGPVVAEGNKDSIVNEINDWLDHITVGDLGEGFHFFHQQYTNEALEQGFGLGEFLINRSKNDIVALNVADSKNIKFRRNKGKLEIWQQVVNEITPDGRELKKREQLIYFPNHFEAGNPYGTPLFRSCEFVSKILTTIDNSLLNSWERFGNPSYKLIYKASKRDEKKLPERVATLRAELTDALEEKMDGKSADFVMAVDKDSDIVLEVIGADGEVMEVQMPARHVLEQILAKSGLSPWMLGFAWESSNDVANQQGTLALAESKTRQKSKLPGFNRIIETLLALRNRSWKKGDWELKFEPVNLLDREIESKANFMDAEAEMLRAGVLPNSTSNPSGQTQRQRTLLKSAQKQITRQKEDQRPVPWPIIDNLEVSYEKLLKDWWVDLENQVNSILGFPIIQKSLHDTKLLETRQKQEGEAFTFNKGQENSIIKALEEALKDLDVSGPDSELLFLYGESLSAGFVRGAEMLDQAVPIADLIRNKQLFDRIAKTGFTRVTDRATTRIIDKIIPSLKDVKPGTNPREVAGELRKLFDKGNSDWERLARTEMTVAAETGKVEEWKENEIKTVIFVPAPDTDATCAAFAGEHPIDKAPIPGIDTHPRCRCALRPA